MYELLVLDEDTGWELVECMEKSYESFNYLQKLGIEKYKDKNWKLVLVILNNSVHGNNLN